MKDAVISLTALAQTHRLAVFRLLIQREEGGMAAGDIYAYLDIPPSSLSFHLKELHHARLIKSKQQGRFVIYTANYRQMKSLIGYLSENCCNGTSC